MTELQLILIFLLKNLVKVIIYQSLVYSPIIINVFLLLPQSRGVVLR